MEWRACYNSSSSVDKRRETPLLILIGYFLQKLPLQFRLPDGNSNPEVIVCRRTANPIKKRSA